MVLPELERQARVLNFKDKARWSRLLTTRPFLEQQELRAWPRALTSSQMVEGRDSKAIAEEFGSFLCFGHQGSFYPCKSTPGPMT